MGQSCFLSSLLTWSIRRWIVAVIAGAGTFLALGLSTAVIPNPVFGRSIPPTDWAMGVLVLTSVLTALLVATYVRNDGPALIPAADTVPLPEERSARRGAVGAVLSYLAIGCPVCNKLVLVALGSTGAVQFFAPIQPYLALAGVGVLGWALVVRLRGEMTCALPSAPPPADRHNHDHDHDHHEMEIAP